MGPIIRGVIHNNTPYLIEYQLTTVSLQPSSQTKITKIDPRLTAKFSFHEPQLKIRGFQYFKKVKSKREDNYGFVRMPPGCVTFSGLTKIEEGKNRISVYVVCFDERQGEEVLMMIMENVVVNSYRDVCLRVQRSLGITNLEKQQAEKLRKRASENTSNQSFKQLHSHYLILNPKNNPSKKRQKSPQPRQTSAKKPFNNLRNLLVPPKPPTPPVTPQNPHTQYLNPNNNNSRSSSSSHSRSPAHRNYLIPPNPKPIPKPPKQNLNHSLSFQQIQIQIALQNPQKKIDKNLFKLNNNYTTNNVNYSFQMRGRSRTSIYDQQARRQGEIRISKDLFKFT